MIDSTLLLSRAIAYAQRNHIQWNKVVELGHGMDGTVWGTRKPSAIKAIHRRKNYSDELECYLRLKASNTHELCGFAVPRLFGWDDDLMVIEISIVQKPRLLDFGKVYFDGAEAKAYEATDLKRLRVTAAAQYGEDWPRVASVLHALEVNFGIYYVDPRPGNIDCGESEKDDPDWDKEPGVNYSDYE